MVGVSACCCWSSLSFQRKLISFVWRKRGCVRKTLLRITHTRHANCSPCANSHALLCSELMNERERSLFAGPILSLDHFRLLSQLINHSPVPAPFQSRWPGWQGVLARHTLISWCTDSGCPSSHTSCWWPSCAGDVVAGSAGGGLIT